MFSENGRLETLGANNNNYRKVDIFEALNLSYRCMSLRVTKIVSDTKILSLLNFKFLFQNTEHKHPTKIARKIGSD